MASYAPLLLLASLCLAVCKDPLAHLKELEDNVDMERDVGEDQPADEDKPADVDAETKTETETKTTTDPTAPHVCTLTDFCEDAGMFKNIEATFHVNDFCQTRKQGACGQEVTQKTGKRLCAMYGNYAQCNLPGESNHCDGLLTKGKIEQLCGDKRTPADASNKICSLQHFCDGSDKAGKVSTSEYCTAKGDASPCSKTNENGNGLKLCRQYALYAECTIGNCDGELGTDEVGQLCSGVPALPKAASIEKKQQAAASFEKKQQAAASLEKKQVKARKKKAKKSKSE